MAGKVQLNYDEMQEIFKLLQQEEDDLNGLLSQTKSKVADLHGNQWIGQGADQFFNEMEGTVLPALGRLIFALNTAGMVANQVMNTIHQADEGTKGFFSGLG